MGILSCWRRSTQPERRRWLSGRCPPRGDGLKGRAIEDADGGPPRETGLRRRSLRRPPFGANGSPRKASHPRRKAGGAGCGAAFCKKQSQGPKGPQGQKWQFVVLVVL